jgi:hypothetical protein
LLFGANLNKLRSSNSYFKMVNRNVLAEIPHAAANDDVSRELDLRIQVGEKTISKVIEARDNLAAVLSPAAAKDGRTEMPDFLQFYNAESGEFDPNPFDMIGGYDCDRG